VSDLATATTDFLAKVESYAHGQAARFSPVLDELIRWSQGRGLEFVGPSRSLHAVTFRIPGAGSYFWTVRPRTGDGAKFGLLTDAGYQLPVGMLEEACREMNRICGSKDETKTAPEVPFTTLIWEPYRVRVLALMERLLAAMTSQNSPPAKASV